MVYIWPEKGVFAYTYTWKSWHLVGFEPTLFGRAKVQPHNAYQPTCQVPQAWWRHCYLSRQYDWKSTDYTAKWKNWDRVGFEHALVEYRESFTTLCVIVLTPSTPSFMSLLPSIASPIQKKYWNIHLQKLGPGGNWTHTVRAGEGTTTLCVLIHLPITRSLMASLLEVAAVWLEKSWLDS